MRLLVTLIFLLVPVLGVWTFYTAPENGWWLPESVTTYAPDIDNLFNFILVLVTIFFILTEGALVWFVFRYSKKDDTKAVFVHGNHKLEFWWTLIPGALLLLIAFIQMGTWADIKYRGNLPTDEPIAHVWASQFDWRIQYPGADGVFGTWDDVESPHLFVGKRVAVDTEFGDDFRDHARLLAHLADRRLLGGLAGIDVSLREHPVVRIAAGLRDQEALPVCVAAHDDTSRVAEFRHPSPPKTHC